MIELREPLAELTRTPLSFTEGKNFAQRVHIYDETLRDGEQMPGVAFSPEQKVRLAKVLSDLGADALMAAFPAASKADAEALRLILAARSAGRLRDDLEIMTIARATESDIAATVRAAGDPAQVGILLLSTTSDLHLKYKLGRTLLRFMGVSEGKWLDLPVSWYRRANLEFIGTFVTQAAKLGFCQVEFASEDASRADVAYVIEWAGVCREAGGTRLCFSDTCGVLTPESVDHYFPALVAALPGFPVTAHFHNDFGLGALNTVRALGHGATHASMSACGIGERAGNTAMHQVVMILRELYGVVLPRFRYDMLWEVRRQVEECSGIPIQPHEPIIGDNVFAHESGMHTAGIAIHPAIYQVIDEKLVGGHHRVVYGKHSGAGSIEDLIARRGIDVPDSAKAAADALAEVKRRREERAAGGGHEDAIRRHYDHLGGLGISEEEVAGIVLASLGAASRENSVRED